MSSIIVILLFINHVLIQDNYGLARNKMVDKQIAARGIRDPETLKAMKAVPRHHFVPADSRRMAYDDRPLLIGYTQSLSQT